MSASAKGRTRLQAAARGATLTLLTGVCWFSLLDFPNVGDHGRLDDSWQESYGYFLKHRLQAGQDYVFTCGPLGYFYTTAYDPDLFGYKVAWELAGKLIAAVVLVIVARRLPGWFLPALLGGVVLLFWAPEHREVTDAFYPFLIVAGGVLLLGADRPRWLGLAAYAILLAFLCQVKFSLCILSLATMTLLAAYFFVSGHRHRAAGSLGFFALGFLATWVLAGQSPANLPAYFRGSIEIARGYAEAMALAASLGEMVFALGVMLTFAVLLLTFDLRGTSRARVVFLVLLFGVSFALQWKHGFTRQASHVAKFFAFSLVLPFLPASALRPRPALWPVRNLLACACVGLSLCPRYGERPERLGAMALVSRSWTNLRANAWVACAPLERRAHLDEERSALRESRRLPGVRARVAGASVDVFSYEQVVLFANELNWRPRPVFQSYSAYTPELLAINAAFLRSELAPDYLLVHWLPIDDRFPASEDGRALLVLLRDYAFVLMEQEYALFERRRAPRPARPEPRILCQRAIHLGEVVDVSGWSRGEQTLALHLRYSARGRLRNLLYAPAPLFLSVWTEDGSTDTFRLIPALAEGGFLLNPLLRRTEDLPGLAEGRGVRVVAFQVHTHEGEAGYFEPEGLMTLKEE